MIASYYKNISLSGVHTTSFSEAVNGRPRMRTMIWPSSLAKNSVASFDVPVKYMNESVSTPPNFYKHRNIAMKINFVRLQCA